MCPAVLSGLPRSTPFRVVLATDSGSRRNSQWIDFSSGDEPTGTDPGGLASSPSALPVLLRKEVIQPHLPVRLPCYDFVPIADPTFDGSLPKGLGHRLRVLPTFVV